MEKHLVAEMQEGAVWLLVADAYSERLMELIQGAQFSMVQLAEKLTELDIPCVLVNCDGRGFKVFTNEEGSK